jgi:hypothetical protein
VDDDKYISVSGSGTFNGTNLYLTEASPTVPQDFGVYFDSKNQHYAEANIFSATYIQDNQKLIEKQKQ